MVYKIKEVFYCQEEFSVVYHLTADKTSLHALRSTSVDRASK